FLEVVGLAGAAPVTLEPRLAVTDRDDAESLQAAPTTDEPIVAIHPGATDPRRRWPPAYFAAVADELAARGARVVVIGSAEDVPAAAEIVETAHHPALDLTTKLSLPGMVGLLARSVLVIGNDSGPRHLAGAVGTATIGIYWCGNLINAGPLTRARHRVGVSFRVNCPTCGMDQGRGRCEHDPSFVADVPVADVFPHALELFDSEATR
ncbi:MAG: glycosyltransferase family 9 protein, partial [Actinomycetota bacterium]|nr:glycosyltransferase family 9 protein [Actinomycetota bacterium]